MKLQALSYNSILIVNLLMDASDNYHFTKVTHEKVLEKFWCFLQLKGFAL